MVRRENAVIRTANKSSTDLTGYEGYVVVNDSGIKLAATASLASSLGVITDGGKTESSIAILGAYSGTLSMKAGGTITKFAKVIATNGGKVTALSTTGTVVGIALEAAAEDELFEVAPLQPYTVS